MSLRDWLRNRWLVEHQSSREEINGLLALADRDLAASGTPGLNTDWRFNYSLAQRVRSAASLGEA